MKTVPKRKLNSTDTMHEADDSPENVVAPKPKEKEIGGPTGPDPTRFGDWERAGRCIDF